MFQSKRETKGGMLAEIERDHGAKPTEARTVSNNTLHYRIGDKEFWRLHQTDILVRNTKTGDWTLNSGGWITNTTKDRMNEYGPVRIGQEKGQWFLFGRGADGATDYDKRYPYADGMVVGEDGVPKNVAALEKKSAETAALLKKISKFCTKVHKTIVKDGLPQPSAGDCWLCSMSEVKTGKGWGETTGDVEHLLNHMDEGYVHGSLLIRAMKARRNDQNIAYVWQSVTAKPEGYFVKDIVSDLRRYLKRALKVG